MWDPTSYASGGEKDVGWAETNERGLGHTRSGFGLTDSAYWLTVGRDKTLLEIKNGVDDRK